MSVFLADEQSYPLDADRLVALAAYVLAEQRVPDVMEVSLLCVDTQTITRLNEHHMDSKGPTDVLAFPLDLPSEIIPEAPAILGDVVLCPPVAAEHARAENRQPQDELDLLVVHGILHLLGHDHAEPHERDAMFALTDRLLSEFAAHAEAR